MGSTCTRIVLYAETYTILLFCCFRKMNAFLDQFESKSKHSTVSREAAAVAATTASDTPSEYTFSHCLNFELLYLQGFLIMCIPSDYAFLLYS